MLLCRHLLVCYPNSLTSCLPSDKAMCSINQMYLLSTAPEPFLLLINPGYACISLSCIATGVLMFRLGIFYKDRKK